MRNYAKLCKLCETIRNYAKLRETTRNYAKLCDTMRNYAELLWFYYCIFTIVCLLLYFYYCMFTIVFYYCSFTIVCLLLYFYYCIFTIVFTYSTWSGPGPLAPQAKPKPVRPRTLAQKKDTNQKMRIAEIV